jgi:hypothetical protein
VRKQGTVNGAELVKANWPPQAYSWSDQVPSEAWWLSDTSDGPKNAYLRRFLQEPETMEILNTMSLLGDIDTMIAAVSEHPDLALRATKLHQRIELERKMQQTVLDRLAMRWLLNEINRSSRYLILSRLVMAKIYEQQNSGAQQ